MSDAYRRIFFRAERVVFKPWSTRRRAELQVELKALQERTYKIRSPLYRSLKRNSQRVYDYLVAFVAVGAGDGKPELLIEQLSIWRIVRGISTVLGIVAIEAALVSLVMLGTEKLVFYVVFFGLFIGLVVSARLMTRVAYSRVCETLFSLVKLYSDKPLVPGRQ